MDGGQHPSGRRDGDTEERLASFMSGMHERCLATADDYGRPGDCTAGADIAGSTRVADAMLALGIV